MTKKKEPAKDKITRQASVKPRGKISVDEKQIQTALQNICILLRTYTKHDFSLYKKNTIIRRVERRMHVHQIDNIEDYQIYLARSECEIQVLFKDLLIDLEPKLQKILFPLFYYSLVPDGLLFIGSSESLNQETTLFEMYDRKWKIFKRHSGQSTASSVLNLQVPAPPLKTLRPLKPPEAVTMAEYINNFKLVESILQQSDTPPCVMVDEKLNIVYIHGRIGKYLEPTAGMTRFNILDMARPSLKIVVASAIRKATSTKQEVVRKDVHVTDNGDAFTIDLTVKPVLTYGALYGMIMVVFNDVKKATPESKSTPKPGVPQKNGMISRLEQELQYTNENLQSTIADLKTAYEELQSTNEELQSTNEELQSTNEELKSTNEKLQSTNEDMETSKEELQSLNEESATVNAQLQSQIDELSDDNGNMKNLLNTTQIGTIFLDMDMNIKRYTDMLTRLIPLTMSDIGRPVSHFATQLKEFHLVDHALQVSKDLIPQEFEVESLDGKFFRTWIMPYRTLLNVIDGVVVTFEDISEFA